MQRQRRKQDVLGNTACRVLQEIVYFGGVPWGHTQLHGNLNPLVEPVCQHRVLGVDHGGVEHWAVATLGCGRQDGLDEAVCHIVCALDTLGLFAHELTEEVDDGIGEALPCSDLLPLGVDGVELALELLVTPCLGYELVQTG